VSSSDLNGHYIFVESFLSKETVQPLTLHVFSIHTKFWENISPATALQNLVTLHTTRKSFAYIGLSSQTES